MKCATAGCHRHLKDDLETRADLKRASAEAGAPAGVLCPPCVKKALEEGSDYVLDMSMGEIIAESSVSKPRWRTVFHPQEPLPGRNRADDAGANQEPG